MSTPDIAAHACLPVCSCSLPGSSQGTKLKSLKKETTPGPLVPAKHTTTNTVECIVYNIYVHTYIHTYIHTYTHTHIHTYLLTYILTCIHT